MYKLGGVTRPHAADFGSNLFVTAKIRRALAPLADDPATDGEIAVEADRLSAEEITGTNDSRRNGGEERQVSHTSIVGRLQRQQRRAAGAAEPFQAAST